MSDEIRIRLTTIRSHIISPEFGPDADLRINVRFIGTDQATRQQISAAMENFIQQVEALARVELQDI